MRRRVFSVSAAVALISLTATQDGSAQSTLSDNQKAALQQIYGAQENTVRTLQQLQDTRAAVPLSPREFAKDPLMNMLKATPPNAPDRQLIVYEALHKLSLDLTALDHAVLLKDDPRRVNQYGEEFGPTRSSWALALVHLAMHEAINIFTKKAESYAIPNAGASLEQRILDDARVSPADLQIKTGTLEAAIFYSALGVLSEVYPRKIEFIEARSSELFNDVRGEGVPIGRAIGQSAANAVLKVRGWKRGMGFADGSEYPEPQASVYMSADVRRWKVDPISRLPIALGGLWSHVQPFVIPKADAFRPGPPPAVGSAAFAEAFKEVKKQGGDPNAKNDPSDPVRWPTPTDRKGDTQGEMPYAMNDTFKGIYWGYDGTALLCAPPRLYNMIAMTLVRRKLGFSSVADVARIMALVNLAMGDAGIAAWEAKFYYLYPRPITLIRGADADNTGDGTRDERWTPLGAPVTNGGDMGRNLSPPFPAYPSGHAVFGGAVFQTLRNAFKERKMQDMSFAFLSDEYNGRNYSPGATEARKKVEVTFPNFDVPEEENGQSRIWLGIHWKFDKVEGIKQGRSIGDYVFSNALKLKTAM